MAATEIGTLFLDRALRIVRFTPPIGTLFNVTEHDRGRPIADFTHHLDYPELQADASAVLSRSRRSTERCGGDDGRWFLARLRPYRTTDDRIDGVVVTFVDFTARRQAEDELRRSEERYRLLVEGVAEYAMIMTDANGRITTWNSGARKIFGRSEAESLGQPIAVLFTEEDRASGVRSTAGPRPASARRPTTGGSCGRTEHASGRAASPRRSATPTASSAASRRSSGITRRE